MKTETEIIRACSGLIMKSNAALVSGDNIGMMKSSSQIARVLFVLYTVRSSDLLPIKRKLEAQVKRLCETLTEAA